MTARISQVTLDVRDVTRMSQFWAAVLGYEAVTGGDGCATLHPPQGGEPTLWLQAVSDPTPGKLGCHMDLRCTDPSAEVRRLIGLGATRADVGQRGDEGFDVLADPEGNEFCVLHAPAPRRPRSDPG
jgi:catechol 2,3-dioxygenase-like lactoylglutathione lyase family enzyme